MKICPVCQTNYDNTQNFCLNDGATLVFGSQALNNPPNDEPATVIHANQPSQIGYQPAPVVVQPKSNTGMIVALTALATLLLVGVGVGAYFLLSPKPSNTIAQNNQNAVVGNVNRAASPITNATAAPTPTASPAQSVAPPSPKPTLTKAQAETIKNDVDQAVGEWKQATQNEDLTAHMNRYAPVVNYYNGGKVPNSRVRADRQKAFDTYDDLNVELSNVKITPDPSGAKAVMIFDKSWRFTNAETTSEGAVQQQLTLEKIDGRWLITGEKDLKVYGKDKY